MLADLYRTRDYQNEIAYMRNFIVFEPSSLRVQEADILMRGDELRELFDGLYDEIIRKSTLPDQILQNRITKIARMLDMLTQYNNVVMTKFFNKIWRRYSAVSNIGENFMDMETFLIYFPEHKLNREAITSTRLDASGEDDEAAANAAAEGGSNVDADAEPSVSVETVSLEEVPLEEVVA